MSKSLLPVPDHGSVFPIYLGLSLDSFTQGSSEPFAFEDSQTWLNHASPLLQLLTGSLTRMPFRLVRLKRSIIHSGKSPFCGWKKGPLALSPVHDSRLRLWTRGDCQCGGSVSCLAYRSFSWLRIDHWQVWPFWRMITSIFQSDSSIIGRDANPSPRPYQAHKLHGAGNLDPMDITGWAHLSVFSTRIGKRRSNLEIWHFSANKQVCLRYGSTILSTWSPDFCSFTKTMIHLPVNALHTLDQQS